LPVRPEAFINRQCVVKGTAMGLAMRARKLFPGPRDIAIRSEAKAPNDGFDLFGMAQSRSEPFLDGVVNLGLGKAEGVQLTPGVIKHREGLGRRRERGLHRRGERLSHDGFQFTQRVAGHGA
jgi:hypothetical protein